MVVPAQLAERIALVRERIGKALTKAGRSGDSVRLVAVSKTFPAEYVSAAIAAGIGDIGENRVQECAVKKPQVAGSARWHLIGHLQTNKVSKALPLFDLIQSVDSRDLAQEISRRAEREVEVLAQINSSGEKTKHGFAPDSALEDILQLAQLEKIAVRGLMTIGPFVEDERLIRRSFAITRQLFERLKKCEHQKLRMVFLSMGMSSDFELAVAEGSNMVRIGSLIFGARE